VASQSAEFAAIKETLAERTAKFEKATAEHDAEVKSLNARLEEATGKIAAAGDTEENLKAKLQSMEMALADVESSKAEMARSLSAEAEALQLKLKEAAEKGTADVAAVQGQLDAKAQAENALKANLETVEANLQKTTEELHAVTSALEQTKSHGEALKTQLEQGAAAHATEKAAQAAEVEVLRSQLATSTASEAALNEKIKGMEISLAELGSSKTDLDALRVQHEEATRQLKEAKVTIEAVQGEIETHKLMSSMEMEAKTEELKAAREQREKDEKAIKELSENFERMHESNNNLRLALRKSEQTAKCAQVIEDEIIRKEVEKRMPQFDPESDAVVPLEVPEEVAETAAAACI